MQEELHIPEEIIQHIHSFMECKPAAQTSLLSKSWYKAWSTRPNLYFCPHDFNFTSKYLDLVTNIVQRYLDLNIKVDKVVLLMSNSDVPSRVDKLINDVLSLRVNVFEFTSRGDISYVLPAQLFAHKYLTELHLNTCKVDHIIPETIQCSNLRSLILQWVSIDDSTFKDILNRCPIIEHLTLYGLQRSLTSIDVSELRNLKTLNVKYYSFGSRAITSSVICGRFLNLSGLVLSYVTVDDSFFKNLSSSFPKLDDLTLEGLGKMYDSSSFWISCCTIKRLSLRHYGRLNMANIDVPNIRNFEFFCSGVPTLSFTTCSKEWKSDLTFSNYTGSIEVSKLIEFLIQIGQSKITLHLSIYSPIDFALGGIEIFRLPAVEELTYNAMKFCEEYDFFIECLLSCRPKLVSLNFYLQYRPNTISILFMYKKLMERRNGNSFSTSTQDSSSFCINDLKEVDVELFEESLQQWQPIKAFPDDLEIWNNEADRIRFKLTWGSFTPKHTIIKLIQCYDKGF